MTWLEFNCRHRYSGGFQLDLAFSARALITALFGPSGSGKTSVLEMITGLSDPAQGRITIGDQIVLDTAERVHVPTERREVGLVFQDHRLFPHLKVDANLRFGWRRRKSRRGNIDFDRVVSVLDLQELVERYPANLSGGERQRVALGRAILSSPRVLLMDEPLAALDEALKWRILDYLARVVDEFQLPTLFVSHSQAEVRRLAEEVIVLEQGRVVDQASPDEALGKAASLGLKNSAEPMNLLRLEDVAVRDGHWSGRLGQQQLWLPPLADHNAGTIFVQLAPGAVALSGVEPGPVSTRNQLAGVVRQVADLPGGTFVAVDVGQILWALVTPEAAEQLKLAPGASVRCLIKAHSLRVLH